MQSVEVSANGKKFVVSLEAIVHAEDVVGFRVPSFKEVAKDTQGQVLMHSVLGETHRQPFKRVI